MFDQLDFLNDGQQFPQDRGANGVIIRKSRRAKQLILKLVPPYRLELVVPNGTRPKAVEAFLESHRGWIRRAHEELDARYPAAQRSLPIAIELKSIDRHWDVDVKVVPDQKPSLDRLKERLILQVPDIASSAGFELLRQWLLRRGREYLKPWLYREADRLGFKPARVQIRTQRTRWGSCSTHGNISLNAALLLLTPSLVRYLMVHELCHLRHLNHSARYWKLVKSYEPDFRAHDRALSASWTEIPLWAMPR